MGLMSATLPQVVATDGTPEAWHTLDAQATIDRVASDPVRGLSTEEASRRLDVFGTNALVERAAKSPWRLLAEQFQATLVVVLIVAGVISALLGDAADAIAIGAIVLLNGLLGFHQEYSAQKAIAALKRIAVPMAKVRRDDKSVEISSSELDRKSVV